jgi:F-type H+-transporting ATPase subunit c
MENLTQLAQLLSASVIAAGFVIGLGGLGAAVGFVAGLLDAVPIIGVAVGFLLLYSNPFLGLLGVK